MATSGFHPRKVMNRLPSKKSHPWWWDSHISPKNSKWLSENLEEMDQSVKRMLKLIEEDADSFAKRAEMYYQKRPELVALVEEFYRRYRALAERYDHVTGELRKNIPSDLQSQGSGISDAGSEPTLPSPTPKRGGRLKSSNRPAGFDYFLGSSGNGSDAQKDGDESSTLTDSENESDDSSVNSGFLQNGSDLWINRRIIELETELRELKGKLWMQEEEHAEVSSRGSRNENSEDFYTKINAYEQELMNVNDKLRLSEEEITKLKIELEKYGPFNAENTEAGFEFSSTKEDVNDGGEALEHKMIEVEGSIDVVDKALSDQNAEIESLARELRITKENLKASEEQITSLKFEANNSSERIQQLLNQLDLATKDIATWKNKFNSEKRESTKLNERLARLKTSLSDRDQEVRDLKTAVSDAEEKIFPEKAELKSEMSKLLEERTHLEEHIRDWECRGRSFEDEIRKIQSEKVETEENLRVAILLLKENIELREITIKDLNTSLDTLQLEKDNLHVEVGLLKEELNSKDVRIEHLNNHLNQLHMEHVQLIVGMEEAHKQVEELKSKAKQFEEEIDRQKTVILDGAEEKREVIRQLCFSLEHYRNSYNMLRQHVMGHKRVPVLAA
ncbi:protein NETWORKED 4A [Vigna radiata var. radiata]|uniref:Protein NETWORKED 4A n=1 Tax=Vigna radiata var. radiata TaxID=3916 RepID=A0A1S3UFF9_VIGRR|nr:protein NETWORKED 4A [Vigna radiata var. radiata]XP_014504763.1 protein NETWORKED 4A [Vigna radiata var. radiata]XP_014504764.1 protein NETWORKED 4A [Vigna radiata var. radiata]